MLTKTKARLIYSTISASESVSGLGMKGALVYTWLLAHCDDQGRFQGTAKKVKALVVPLMDAITSKDVETALQQMDVAGLIVRYSSEGQHNLIQVSGWWDYNAGLRICAVSKYPPPPGWVDRVTERDDMGRFRGTRAYRAHEERESRRRRDEESATFQRELAEIGPSTEGGEERDRYDDDEDIEEDGELIARRPEVGRLFKLKDLTEWTWGEMADWLDTWTDPLYDWLRGDSTMPEDKVEILDRLIAKHSEDEEDES